MSQTPLMRLTNQGLAAVDAKFLAGTPERLADDPSFATPIVGHDFDPAALRFDLPDDPPIRRHDPAIAMALHAQLTREEGGSDDAHRACLQRLLDGQYKTDRLLSLSILRHAPAMLGFLDAVGDEIRWQVLNQVCRRLGLMATTYAVIAMDRAQVRALVAGLYQAVLDEGGYSDEEEPG